MKLRRLSTLRIVRGTLLAAMAAVPLGHHAVRGAEAEGKVGQFITIRAPITPAEVTRVQRATNQVLNDYLAKGKRPTLVFQIEPGASEYHECYKLADFIRHDIPGAERTVAYVPEPLTGHAVMIALACEDLVMHTDASLGDIGRDQTVTPDQRRLYSSLAQERRWPEALVLGMLDKDLEVVMVPGEPPVYALASDLPKLREQGVAGDATTIKRAGEPLQFKAMECRNLGLAKLLVSSRSSVADQYGLPTQATREDPTLGQEPRAVVIKVEGEIDPILSGVVSRGIDRALGQGKNLIIFAIDSPGGRVDSSLEIANKIKDVKGARTVAYIADHALSGASFVALACDEIYMAGDATMGDAGPIFAPGAQFEHAPEKVVSWVAERLSTIAESKGRPPALAEAMVDRNLVVYQARNTQSGETRYLSEQDIQNSGNPQQWKKVKVVTHEDRFLTLNGRDAKEYGLADEVVESEQELWTRLGLESAPPTFGRTTVDDLVYVLNWPGTSFLLILLGVTLLYVELNIPGITLAGVGSFLCFLLFFWSHILGGTAGALEVVLFLAGVGLLAIEIFVIPGFGVTGVSGILCVLASIILASQTFIIPETPFEMKSMITSAGTTVGALLSFVVVAIILSRFLPSLPFLSGMVLKPPSADEVAPALTRSEGLPGPTGSTSPSEGLLDKEGTAYTDLRPAGKARFGGEFLDVVAEGSFVAEGSRIRVIEVTGNRIVVKQV